MTQEQLVKLFDHTNLHPYATPEDMKKLCDEARRYHFAMVAINSVQTELCKELLAGTDVHVGAAISFPLGQTTIETKVFETKDAIAKGATEVDMVINVGALKSGRTDDVYNDIKAVVDAANGTLTKVIIETCYLTDEEKVAVCKLAQKAGADFVKTSTGFGTGGANAHDVKLMKDTVGDTMKVKASGGMRTYEDVVPVLEAGADRLGVSASIAICEGAPE